MSDGTDYRQKQVANMTQVFPLCHWHDREDREQAWRFGGSWVTVQPDLCMWFPNSYAYSSLPASVKKPNLEFPPLPSGCHCGVKGIVSLNDSIQECLVWFWMPLLLHLSIYQSISKCMECQTVGDGVSVPPITLKPFVQLTSHLVRVLLMALASAVGYAVVWTNTNQGL